jgi:aminobenzoyl-glutamate utilization protein B
VDQNEDALRQLNRFVWTQAELGLAEHRSSEEIQRLLSAHGFHIEKGVAHMPTAFVASYGSGKPVIALLAEYDALPGMSQKAEPLRAERVAGASGHACGHSVLGAASVGAAVATRYAMEAHDLPGTVRLYGTPAEETGIGKTYMVKEGSFADCDAALHWHPGDRNSVAFSLSKAVISVKYTFAGRAAHASLSPHEGRSALDAVELMNVAANMLREHLKEDARIHYVITDGGGQPNVVPRVAQVWYYLRANVHEDAEYLFQRMEKIAQGAALMTGTQVQIHVDSDTHELLPNRPLSELIYRNFLLIGPPRFTDEEQAFARKTQEPLVAARGSPMETALSSEIEALPDTPHLIRASTDVGDVSWVVPTSGLRAACYTLGAPGHSWQIVACTGTSIGEKGLMVAAKVLAACTIDLLSNPALITASQDDFQKRRGNKPFKTLVPKEQHAPAKIR